MAGGSLALDGDRVSGQEARDANVTAACAVANVIKSSLGPVGLDQMLVDDIGDVTITNDGATILKLLEVEHPAGKVLVELSELQDQEVGDGTTSVVIFAAELLRRANALVKQKIHPTSVIGGYRLAMKEAVKYITDNLTIKVNTLGRDCLLNVAKTSISSKIIGLGSDHFANLAVDAITSVKTVNDEGKTKYPLKAIHVLKAHGKSSAESQLIQGFALNNRRASEAMPTRITNCKIALLDFKLTKVRLHMGIQIVVSDPKKLEDIRKKEIDLVKDKIEKILKSGANVILTTQTIDDICMKYFIEEKVIAVRRCRKEDLKMISKLTGATLITSMVGMDGEESFDPANLGFADEIVEERVADDQLIYLRGCKNTRACSILLRGPSEFMLDEMERSLHDCLSVLKRTLESNFVVCGGGCVESALSIYLDNYARTLGSREQLAIAEFAEALLVLPKTLSVNAAADATDLIAKLRAYHHTSQTDPSQAKLKYTGLNLSEGKVRNNLDAGVLEPVTCKTKMIQFATEAAITILRIDDIITLSKDQN